MYTTGVTRDILMKHVQSVWAVVLLKTEFQHPTQEVIDVRTTKQQAQLIQRKFGDLPQIQLRRYLLVESDWPN